MRAEPDAGGCVQGRRGLAASHAGARAAHHRSLDRRRFDLPAVSPARAKTGTRSVTRHQRARAHAKNGNGTHQRPLGPRPARSARGARRADGLAHVALRHRRPRRVREGLSVPRRGQRAQDGRLPVLPPARFQRRPRSRSSRDARVMMFGSNNYLGLTTHPKVREAAQRGHRRSSARA